MTTKTTRSTLQAVNVLGMGSYGMSIDEQMREIWEQRDPTFHQAELERLEREQREIVTMDDSVDSPVIFEEEEELPVVEEEEDPAMSIESRNMTQYQRTVLYAIHLQQLGLSKEAIIRNEDAMTLLYGVPPPISYKEHVVALNKELLREYRRDCHYFCCSCNEEMYQGQVACENSNCAIRGVNAKRAKRTQSIEVHTINIIPQLSDVLTHNFGRILEKHEQIHRDGDESEDRSDIRSFVGYHRAIETPDQFLRSHLKVLLTVSIDGFVPKRLSKRQVWPLYLRVEGLPQSEGNKYHNALLAGAVYSRIKPSEKMMEALFCRLEAELQSLREAPMMIEFNGRTWDVDVKIFKGVADMAAQQALFGTPRWTSDYGCSKCYVKGMRLERSRAWIADSEEDTRRRSRESYEMDGELGQYGIMKKTATMRMILPCDFIGDALHVCSEGVTRDRLRDLLNPKTKFPDMRISRENLQKLKECLLSVSSHTYANSLILSIEDLPTCKAMEVDELAGAVFPLTAAALMIPCPTAATALLGYWLCLKIISKSRTLTARDIETAKSVARDTREIWIKSRPSIYTMKCHWFFDHSMTEEITTYGSPYQWTTAPFESLHRRLQVNVNQTTTNSTALILDKYLTEKKLRHLLNEQTGNNSAITALKKKMDNKHVDRFPVDIRINNDIYIPKNSGIKLDDLRPSHRMRIQRSCEQPYSRLVINKKVYSSRLYWKRSNRSRQDLIFYNGNEVGEELDQFGSILLFLYNPRTKSVSLLLDEYICSDPFEHLHEKVAEASHQAQEVYHRWSDMYTTTRTQFYKERQNKCVVKRRVVAEDVVEENEVATPVRTMEPKKTQYYTTMSQMKPNAVTRKRPVVEENDDVVEETENGCIYERRDLRDDIEEEGNLPCTLFECVSNGVLHMDQAARMVWKKKKEGTFNRAVYEEFIRSDVAARARPIFDELDQDNDDDWWRYNFLALRILITAPPSEIQRYSMRINRRAGRCEALQNLPEQVEDTFIGFGIDVLGFGRRELEEGATNLHESTFYMGLGATELDRKEALSKIQRQKAEWKSYMYTALQKALRDIRSYSFDQCTGWTPSPKQAKRTGEECPQRTVMDSNLDNSD